MGKETLTRENLPAGKATFFTRDKTFYKTFFQMMFAIALQNILTYSVNVADNLMLGAYNQSALAGVAAVNQIQYILQQVIMLGLGEGLIILAGQYWGKGDSDKVEKIAGLAITIGLLIGAVLTAIAFISPVSLIRIFTEDVVVQSQAVEYLGIMRYTYLMFIVTQLLLVTLRSVKLVGFAFKISTITLIVNLCIDYVLIYGRFGAPEMGIRGNAIGTLIARSIELVSVLLYCRKKTLPIRLKLKNMFSFNMALVKDYLKVSSPCVASAVLFSSAVAIQTAIFGHISSDALAAASVAGTLFQFVKMIPSSAAASASVQISNLVGSGKHENLRTYVRTLQLLFLAIGGVVCVALLLIRLPLISFYAISSQAKEYALQMTFIQAFIAVGMSYQMPCQVGIVRSGGDTRYVMISDIIYSWVITVPLSLLAAFVFKLPFAAIVLCLNIDQILKCITVSLKVNSYSWVKRLTK